MQQSMCRRVKERYIWEAIEKVQKWRVLFQNGIQNPDGSYEKLSLNQAAQLVGIPRKTLEDYKQLLNKSSLYINLQEVCNKKMGFLRRFVREHYTKKNKTKKVQIKEQVTSSADEEKQTESIKQIEESEQFEQNQRIIFNNIYEFDNDEILSFQNELQQEKGSSQSLKQFKLIQFDNDWSQMIVDGPIDQYDVQSFEYPYQEQFYQITTPMILIQFNDLSINLQFIQHKQKNSIDLKQKNIHKYHQDQDSNYNSDDDTDCE